MNYYAPAIITSRIGVLIALLGGIIAFMLVTRVYPEQPKSGVLDDRRCQKPEAASSRIEYAIVDPANGVRRRTWVAADRIIVVFSVANDSDLARVLELLHGCVLEALPDVNAYSIKITEVQGQEELRAIIDLVRAQGGVESAEPSPVGRLF